MGDALADDADWSDWLATVMRLLHGYPMRLQLPLDKDGKPDFMDAWWVGDRSGLDTRSGVPALPVCLYSYVLPVCLYLYVYLYCLCACTCTCVCTACVPVLCVTVYVAQRTSPPLTPTCEHHLVPRTASLQHVPSLSSPLFHYLHDQVFRVPGPWR